MLLTTNLIARLVIRSPFVYFLCLCSTFVSAQTSLQKINAFVCIAKWEDGDLNGLMSLALEKIYDTNDEQPWRVTLQVKHGETELRWARSPSIIKDKLPQFLADFDSRQTAEICDIRIEPLNGQQYMLWWKGGLAKERVETGIPVPAVHVVEFVEGLKLICSRADKAEAAFAPLMKLTRPGGIGVPQKD